MFRLDRALAVVVAVVVAATGGTAYFSSAQEINSDNDPRSSVRASLPQESGGSASLRELIDAAPDGREIVELFKSIRVTSKEIRAANHRVDAEMSKLRLIEAELNQRHLAVVRDCMLDDQLNIANVQLIAVKSRLLDQALADIDARLNRSIATMKRNLESAKPGIVTNNTKSEYGSLANAHNEYVQSSLSAHVIADALGWMVQSLPAALQACQPIVAPPLFDDESKPPPKAPGKATRKALQAPIRRLPMGMSLWPQGNR